MATPPWICQSYLIAGAGLLSTWMVDLLGKPGAVKDDFCGPSIVNGIIMIFFVNFGIMETWLTIHPQEKNKVKYFKSKVWHPKPLYSICLAIVPYDF